MLAYHFKGSIANSTSIHLQAQHSLKSRSVLLPYSISGRSKEMSQQQSQGSLFDLLSNGLLRTTHSSQPCPDTIWCHGFLHEVIMMAHPGALWV